MDTIKFVVKLIVGSVMLVVGLVAIIWFVNLLSSKGYLNSTTAYSLNLLILILYPAVAFGVFVARPYFDDPSTTGKRRTTDKRRK